MPAAGLTLHTSNRLENLSAALAEAIGEPLRSPLASEIVIVQSNGMRRWLTQELARQHGICANIRFPFPQRFFRELFAKLCRQNAHSEVFEREPLSWRIMALLPQMSKRPEFAAVANYLAGERAELRRFQLARKIAHVFDQYLVFRPQLILEWDGGKGDGWQAILWHELQRAAPLQHQAALGRELAGALADGAELPERVSIFGLSTLPPFYVALVEQLSIHLPVHLFVLEPTPLWWGDIRTRRERARAKQPELDFGGEGDNALLAENGKLGRDFLNLVADLTPREHRENFRVPPVDTVLHRVQHDLFELTDNNAGSLESEDDRSLQIHSCHSVTRELEVLHDQLLALFENDSALTPRDIVVMMPDVSVYAPFVDAVFGDPESSELKIPYSIADRSTRARSGVIDTFLRLLETLPGRFRRSEVFAILESPAVRRRFGLTDVELIQRWTDRCGIRWGIDGAHRARLGLPAFSQNSWRHGFDRMLLGYAMQPQGRQLFAEILPFDEIEGGDAQMLGWFVDFAERLFARAADFATPRPLEDWQRDLLEVIDEFLDADEATQPEVNQLRAALAAFSKISRASANTEPVSLEIAARQLGHLLDDASSGAGFLSGSLTFCALKPMRSIPFKVVCLLGLNATAYPRRERAPEFDLIAQRRQRGDRNTRDDDRALFLEALLSARDVFYLSFLGQSLRDNKTLPPSVVVSELLDYVTARFGFDSAKFVVRHSLQAFSPRNFGKNDSRRFSYSTDNSQAGAIAGGERCDPVPFLAAPLAEAPPAEVVELAELIEFFAHPVKFFVRRRLQIELPREIEDDDDREPFTLHALDSYSIEQELLDEALSGRDLAPALAGVRASGMLPPGGTGLLAFEELCGNVRAFAEVVSPYLGGELRPPQAIALEIDGTKVRGTLDRIRGDTLVRYRLANLKAKDFLCLWLEHLARNVNGSQASLLFGKEAAYSFAPCANAVEILSDLLALYHRGLREPLRFFPRTSWKYAEKLFRNGGDDRNARYQAGQVWRGDGRGEREDAFIRLAFRGTDLSLNEEWEETTRAIAQPLFHARGNL